MSPELDRQLCDRYPLIFRYRQAGEEVSAMGRGFEHGDGWLHILDILCHLLYRDYLVAADAYAELLEQENATPSLAGTLSLEHARRRRAKEEAARKVPAAMQVKEKFGVLRFHVDKADERARRFIEFAQAMSARACETCGSPGRLRSGSWRRTLCDQHAAGG